MRRLWFGAYQSFVTCVRLHEINTGWRWGFNWTQVSLTRVKMPSEHCQVVFRAFPSITCSVLFLHLVLLIKQHHSFYWVFSLGWILLPPAFFPDCWKATHILMHGEMPIQGCFRCRSISLCCGSVWRISHNIFLIKYLWKSLK